MEYYMEYNGTIYECKEVTVLSVGATYIGYMNGFDLWLGVDDIIYIL